MSAWAAEIDFLSYHHNIVFVQSVGNVLAEYFPPLVSCPGIVDHLKAGREYPKFLTEDSFRVANPGHSLQAITVGSITNQQYRSDEWKSFASKIGEPSPFSRTGCGIWNVTKPDVVEFGGDMLRSDANPPDVSAPIEGRDCYPELVRSTLHGGPIYDRDDVGTSFAAPKVTKIVAELQRTMPEETSLLYRALIIQSARWPEWTENIDDPAEKCRLMRSFGFGIPNIERATTNSNYRSTLISNGAQTIRPTECKIFQIPIPDQMRSPGEDFEILIEVTLSYAAQPRRTRRHRRKYLSTWLDWKSSNLREPMENFRRRALKDTDSPIDSEKGTPIPWTIHEQGNWGKIDDIQRSAGTVQKDWAVVSSNALPENFCIAINAHKGWSQDPDTEAKFALAVSFESINLELEIYEILRVSVDELQAELAELELNV